MGEIINNLSRSYYMEPVKIVRDLVHGYVNLTRFDLKLVDTVPFQRLSEVRQLTCQHVYPAARHTRFEHSLGVYELMRSAIRHLNKNGILGKNSGEIEKIFDENLEFNACIAALLHDVGHCPFSHMGEDEFNKKEVRAKLTSMLKEDYMSEKPASLIEHLESDKKAGAVHEQLSCIVLLQDYWEILRDLSETVNPEEAHACCALSADFELIIRSILGIEYELPGETDSEEMKKKNVVVRLLNSSAFDVDKLDYIMRDSFFTGIGTPVVDRQRLFRNMYLDDQYRLVFTSRAIPALQNMIDARDELYLYVYNHHAVVYSDFLNTYISRRLSHNASAFYLDVYPKLKDSPHGAEDLKEILETAPIFPLGFLPKSYYFSVDAVAKARHSDSSWLSLLNIVHCEYDDIVAGAKTQEYAQVIDAMKPFTEDDAEKAALEKLKEPGNLQLTQKGLDAMIQKWTTPSGDDVALPQVVRSYLEKNETQTESDIDQAIQNRIKGVLCSLADQLEFVDPQNPKGLRPYQRVDRLSPEVLKKMGQRVYGTMKLIHQSMTRDYLKPWWKTVFEFNSFMGHYFRDDRIRRQVELYICKGGPGGLQADEMRSQIAKHMIGITVLLSLVNNGQYGKERGLYRALEEGDFFVIQRSPRFFSPHTIEELEIALKNNEILGSPENIKRRTHDYYIKNLTNVIPQKDYSDIYDENGFYVFSRRIEDKVGDEKKARHYRLLESLFAFVCQELVIQGEPSFVSKFQSSSVNDRTERETESICSMFLAFSEAATDMEEVKRTLLNRP